MATVDLARLVEEALADHRAGRLADAERKYRDALQIAPHHADALHLLGMLHLQRGQDQAGEAMLRQAVQLNPRAPVFRVNLGTLLQKRGQLENAAGEFRKAVELEPKIAEGWGSLCAALKALGKFEESIAAGRQAVQLKPKIATFHFALASALNAGGNYAESLDVCRQGLSLGPNTRGFGVLGIALSHLGRKQEAVQAFEQAVQLDRNAAAALYNLGCALLDVEQTDRAIAALREAVRLDPKMVEGWTTLGGTLSKTQDFPGAAEAYGAAVALKPTSAGLLEGWGIALSKLGRQEDAIAAFRRSLSLEHTFAAHLNLGEALRLIGRNDEAVTELETALRMNPQVAEGFNDLGVAYTQQDRHEEAAAAYERAVTLKPDYAEAHMNWGLNLLLRGQFAKGWPEYAWHESLFKTVRSGVPLLEKGMWGGDLQGKRIWLYADQGLGDTLHFARYAAEFANRGAVVVLECQPLLKEILRRTKGIAELVGMGEAPVKCDAAMPLMCAGAFFETDLQHLPGRAPYVFGDAAAAGKWKAYFAARGQKSFRIGIAWQGNRDFKGDWKRSIPLTAFEPLANTPGVELVSLQKGYGAEQLEKLAGRFAVTTLDGVMEDGDGFVRTAAIMENLDLVICPDTGVAHLAGAMGIKTWLLLPTACDWRWLLDREDCPWYPTVRLFRQKKQLDWAEVFERVAGELRKLN